MKQSAEMRETDTFFRQQIGGDTHGHKRPKAEAHST